MQKKKREEKKEGTRNFLHLLSFHNIKLRSQLTWRVSLSDYIQIYYTYSYRAFNSHFRASTEEGKDVFTTFLLLCARSATFPFSLRPLSLSLFFRFLPGEAKLFFFFRFGWLLFLFYTRPLEAARQARPLRMLPIQRKKKQFGKRAIVVSSNFILSIFIIQYIATAYGLFDYISDW